MEEERDQSCETSPLLRLPATNSFAAYPGHDGGIFSRRDGNGGSASKGRTIRDLRVSRTSTRISCACQWGTVFRRCGWTSPSHHIGYTRTHVIPSSTYRAPKGGRPMTEREEWGRGQDDPGLPHTSAIVRVAMRAPEARRIPFVWVILPSSSLPIIALSPRTHSRDLARVLPFSPLPSPLPRFPTLSPSSLPCCPRRRISRHHGHKQTRNGSVPGAERAGSRGDAGRVGFLGGGSGR